MKEGKKRLPVHAKANLANNQNHHIQLILFSNQSVYMHSTGPHREKRMCSLYSVGPICSIYPFHYFQIDSEIMLLMGHSGEG